MEGSPATPGQAAVPHPASSLRDAWAKPAPSSSPPPDSAAGTATTTTAPSLRWAAASSGSTKTFKRERPDALVKAVDFAPSRKTAALADVLIAETQRDPGVVEVGHHRRPALDRHPPGAPHARADPTGIELGADSVFVVTGAAGSIVSAIIADLARASRRDLPPARPGPRARPDDPDLAAFAHRPRRAEAHDLRTPQGDRRAGHAGDGREGAGRHRAAPRGPRRPSRRSRRPAAPPTTTASTCSTARPWRPSTGQICETSGRVDVLVHAGGLEISRLLPDKDAGGVRPRLRREGRRLVQPAHTDSATSPSAHRRVQLDRRALRQRRPDRLQRRQRPALQVDVQLQDDPARDASASPSTGPPGATSAWPPAARFPRS